MVARVTQTYLEVLTTPGAPKNGFLDAEYEIIYNANDGFLDCQYELNAHGAKTGAVHSEYDLESVLQIGPAPILEGHYTLNAYKVGQTHVDGFYDLLAFQQLNGTIDAEYVLNSMEPFVGFLDSNQDLLAFEQLDGFADASYLLDAYIASMGALDAVYLLNSVNAREGAFDAQFDLLAFEPASGFTDGMFDLLAFEARTGALDADYDLAAAFLQLTTRIHTQYQLNAYLTVNGFLDGAFDLEAYLELTGSLDGAFDLNALKVLTGWTDAQYDTFIYSILNGFTDGFYALKAFEAADGFTDAQYDLTAYVVLTGFTDAMYDLFTLLQAQGWMDAEYLLDATEAVYTWVQNQNTGAPSRYENHDFHSFAKLGPDYLGARDDGIYLLDAADDQGTDIDAIASTGRLDFGSTRAKRVLAAYIGLSSSGQMHLTLRTDGGKTTGPFQLRVPSTGAQVERTKLQKGIKSRYWEFDIENVLGSASEIDEIELDVIELPHRLKR